MSMPIQRQSESFGIFDDGPRYARDRASHDLPKGLAGLINTTGPRIQAGLLNTRQAVNTEGMNPEDHAYGLQTHNPLFGEYGHDGYDYEGVSPSAFKRHMRDRDLDQEIADAKEEEDDESGYNWGPVPPEHYGAVSEDYSGGDEDDPDWIRDHSPRQQEHNRKRGEEISRSKEMFGSRLPFDRAAGRRLANEGAEPWMNPEDFIKYHNDYFGRESDPITQDNIRGMSDHELHGYWKDLENARGKTPEQLSEEREQGKAKAKEIADGLWNAFYPPEEEEGRKSVQNMDTIGKLMDNGWQPEHIKYDEDDQPYGFYQHPSGWNVKDYGGMYKDIGHAATPDESHDVINVSHNIDGQDYHEPFGPSEAHNFIENQLHGDPEETGGTFQYLTQNHPAIKRYKPRQAAIGEWVEPNDDPESPHYRNRDYAGLWIGADPGWGNMPSYTISQMPEYRMPDEGLPTKVRTNSRKTAKGKCECWEGYERVPGTKPCAEGSCRKCDSHRKESARTADLMPQQMPQGGGYQIGHRVGLPWRGENIPGTVIGLSGPNVNIRWDDGQYSNEEPHNIQLL